MTARTIALLGLLSLPLAALAQTPPATTTPAPRDGPEEMSPRPPRNLLNPHRGKLPLTGGFSDVDGARGGGLVPCALITGHGSHNSYGFNGHIPDVERREFDLRTRGVGIGIADRVELSASR